MTEDRLIDACADFMHEGYAAQEEMAVPTGEVEKRIWETAEQVAGLIGPIWSCNPYIRDKRRFREERREHLIRVMTAAGTLARLIEDADRAAEMGLIE